MEEDPPLPDELVEEVVVRSPLDDPARLVYAALVCKGWSRLFSARAFRHRFRDFHLQRRGAPMLGFFTNDVRAGGKIFAQFVRTAASCPPIDTQRGCLARDARGGRVLLDLDEEYASLGLFECGGAVPARIRLAVWDPLSAAAGGGHLEVPAPIVPWNPNSWTAALICDQHGLLDNADGHFRIVLAGTDREGTFVCVYSSSGPAVWSQPIYVAQYPDPGDADGYHIDRVPGALVRNAFYCFFQSRTSILKYDLATGDMSVIGLPLPPPSLSAWRMLTTVLTTTEDGGLGFARVEGDKLCLWSMEPSPNGGALAMEWIQGQVIDLRSLLPGIDFLGFEDGIGMILVGTVHGFFSVDQKSGWIDKLVDGPSIYGGIVPYVSFYTPALGKASTDEGPSATA